LRTGNDCLYPELTTIQFNHCKIVYCVCHESIMPLLNEPVNSTNGSLWGEITLPKHKV
jgi:hypothetical protein